MTIRRYSFFEIIFPLTVVFFVCIGTSFVDAVGASLLRWIFFYILFLYLFLNKEFLIDIYDVWKLILIVYILWCVSTTIWSEVPMLSFSKSTMFALNIITMISAGGLWVKKYGFERSLNWLFLVLFIAMLSGVLGGFSEHSIDQMNDFNLYAGLTHNPNAFGFLVAIVSPLIFFNLYRFRRKHWYFIFWSIILALDIHFLLASYSRSCIVIFMSVLSFFILSLPLSRKIFIAFFCFFLIAIVSIMMPVNYIEKLVLTHLNKVDSDITKIDTNAIFYSRMTTWQKSLQQAQKGGMMGGGFAVTIGEGDFSIAKVSGIGYGREKSNSQLAIMEETGIIGLLLYSILLVCFFLHVMPHYLRMKNMEKVVFGLTMGSIVGLFLESLVEAWWDSAAGPEVICFWTFVGMIFGMIYLKKRQVYVTMKTK